MRKMFVRENKMKNPSQSRPALTQRFFSHYSLRQSAMRTVLASAIMALCSSAYATPEPSVMDASALDIIRVLPAYEYDSLGTAVQRRRPGYPRTEPRRGDQNKGHNDPAPIDAVGEILPVPDRWRIMESLGLKDAPWDPYHQNTLKGDKPLKAGEDWFLQLVGVSDTVLEPQIRRAHV